MQFLKIYFQELKHTASAQLRKHDFFFTGYVCCPLSVNEYKLFKYINHLHKKLSCCSMEVNEAIICVKIDASSVTDSGLGESVSMSYVMILSVNSFNKLYHSF